MFQPFPIPANIEQELVTFFKQQDVFPLSLINSRRRSGDSLIYRQELSKHYGVYVIYYAGSHPLYSDISDQNRTENKKPIYVGKAVSIGSRIGGQTGVPTLTEGNQVEQVDDELSLIDAQLALKDNPEIKLANNLFKRLNEHANNIRKTNTLSIDDFQVRVIPMADAMVQWAEATMIKRLTPIWNARISGFGNHDPGSGRYEQARSIWDQIHPGRTWALKLNNLTPYSEEELSRYIRMTLNTNLDD